MMKEEHPIAKSLNHLSLKYLLIQKINPTLACDLRHGLVGKGNVCQLDSLSGV